MKVVSRCKRAQGGEGVALIEAERKVYKTESVCKSEGGGWNSGITWNKGSESGGVKVSGANHSKQCAEYRRGKEACRQGEVGGNDCQG